jgi:malonyl-ACP decarboxylase
VSPAPESDRRYGTGIAVTSAAVLHPAAATVAELDRVLRHGEPTLRPTPVPGTALVVPAAQLEGFDLRSWAGVHCADPASRDRLRRVAGRATLPVRTACCVALAAFTAARLTEAEARDTSVVIAGNNLALGHQSRTAAAYATDPATVRAGHLLDCFDTDALGAVGEVTGCGGEGWPIGGSSAAGALALIHATRMVAAGQAPRCLVVAPVNDLSPVEIAAFVKAGAMARVGAGGDAVAACRPFDESHDGIAVAQIAAAVLIEPVSEARRRGIRPLGLILGSGTSTDARRGTRPDTDGQVRAMRRALSDCGLDPSDIDYVNAHATGSAVGDDSEAAALAEVFGGGATASESPAIGSVSWTTAAESRAVGSTAAQSTAVDPTATQAAAAGPTAAPPPAAQSKIVGSRGVATTAPASTSVGSPAPELTPVRSPEAPGPWINSTKALLGHGLGAAGLVEMIATLLQLADGYCHANPHLTKPVRPDLRFVTGTITRAPLRTALSNSFAFSGINASLVLGRAEEDRP